MTVFIDIDIDIDIFKSDLIDIDIDIDIDIFKKSRYIDNRYGLSIYRTPLPQENEPRPVHIWPQGQEGNSSAEVPDVF